MKDLVKKDFGFALVWVVLLVAAMVSIVNIVNPLISIGLAVCAAFCLLLYQKPVYGLVLLVLVTPLTGTELFGRQIAGIPGFKLANILTVAAVFFYMATTKPHPLGKTEKVFTYGLIAIFTIAVFRSTAFIAETYNEIWDNDEYTVVHFLLSHLVRPLLIFLTFLLILHFVRTLEDIRKILYSTLASIIVLSVLILLLYVFATPDKLNFQQVRLGFGEVLGMHGNNIADFYIIVYPLLLAYTVSKKKLLLMGGTFLSLLAVAVIYSRSAYFVILICTVLFFIVSGRKKWIPVFAFLAALSYSVIPQTVIQRALTGFGDSDLNNISAGRTSDIWMPLIMEYLDHPWKMIVGGGRYAIMGTNAFKDGLILKVGHAHSMYLDTFLDAGAIGLLFFVIFFIAFLVKFIKSHAYIQDRSLLDAMFGIEISLVSFLIRGVTDSFFFPTLTNSYIWVVLGLGMAIVYVHCGTGSLSASNADTGEKRL